MIIKDQCYWLGVVVTGLATMRRCNLASFEPPQNVVHDEFPGGIEITVEDDGPGIDKRIEPYLFVKGVSGTSDEKGRGLALARAELLMYSGDLQLISAPAQRRGAAFRILFLEGKAHVPTSKPTG